MEVRNANHDPGSTGDGKPPSDPRQGRPPRGARVDILPIDVIRDADSPRLAGEVPEHVKLLAGLDVELPPIVVHHTTMRVVDGMHRLAAAKLRGRKTIEVTFFRGDEDEAFVEAVRSNVSHGLPLSLADRRAAATRILRLHAQWSDRMIAGMVGLSPKTVGAIRRSSEELPHLTARIGRDGRVRGPRLPRARPEARPGEDGGAGGAAPATALVPEARSRSADVDRHNRDVDRHNRDIEQLKRTYRLLCQDPSLRMTESGRLLLRLLHLHLVGIREWEQLLETVPPHRVESVAHLAGECARTWLDFADRIARQSAGVS
ncbi:ParB/RepB/Spo0J family partition protein [Saccharothrix longispora]|uniref:ParB-like N-terminal domain-containing protein n=1 Tax=Saccharothrix longispora TaxID=33920 RepID=A0ABU1PWB8_9PSEU|nr:ParB N-terminal domain-containing protein [Saccharothrix longispora]MDR6594568.1 hypothetical protein [Saccharothrix longispora]